MLSLLPHLDIAFYTGIGICMCILLMFAAAQEQVRRVPLACALLHTATCHQPLPD